MAEVCKLLFDLSLYYTLTGFYLRCISGEGPSAVCFLALALCAVLDAVLRARGVKHRLLRVIPLLLPLAALAAKPGLIPFLHCLPAWAYLAFSILTERTETTYDEFRAHFGFGLKALLLLVFGPLFPGALSDAALGTIPYLIWMLVSGVCMLRVLREGRGGVRQALYMGAFVLLCAGLTVGHAPQMLLKAVGYVYRGVVAPLVFLIAVVLAAALYIFYLLAKWLVARAQGDAPELNISLASTADMLGLSDQYQAYTADLRWLKTLLIVLLCALAAFLLFLLFRRLLGDRARPSVCGASKEKRTVLPGTNASQRAPGKLRPRDPRLAVRWYYARFLEECARRGLRIERGMTVAELCAASAPLFPGADVQALAEVYLPARYQLSGTVSKEDVRRAAAAWKALKQSKRTDEIQKKKNKP